MSHKKERIKDRMLKTTARLWGVPENEIDTDFDPLVMLMIEACAAELEKIGYDINASHERLLDKLADLMVPESVVGPKTASCIMQATPVDTYAMIDTMTRFYCTQRITRPEQRSSYNTDLFFTPIGKFPLSKAVLSYMLIGNKLYELKENNNKDLVHGSDAKDSNLVQDIWLAVTPDNGLTTLKNLNFYFDMRSHSEAGTFYKSLDGAKGFIGNVAVNLNAGYYDDTQFELSPEAMLVSGNDYTGKINRQTAGIYRKQFMHIAGSIDLQSMVSKTAPAEWQHALPAPILQKATANPMLYIRIKLSRPFYQDVLAGLICAINSFPAINRKYNTINYRTDTWINIIPLQIEGSFLDLHDITGSSGKKYKFRADADKNGLEEGEAAVRSSGIGKTNSHEVREIISSLTEAIRDESAYFSEISNEFILARLREISQILTRLEDQLAVAKDKHTPHHYILLRPHHTGDHVSIDFWTTNAEDANQVKAGTVMSAFNHTLVGARSAFTITSAMGGKAGVTEKEKKQLLKRQLASKGKLISAEDIKMLCAQMFGNMIRKTEVKKGVQIGYGASEGFIRTIDVTLHLNEDIKGTATEEITYLCKELEHILETEASPVYPFRVILS